MCIRRRSKSFSGRKRPPRSYWSPTACDLWMRHQCRPSRSRARACSSGTANALHDKDAPIRFGITCTATTVGEWQARCLEHLLELENVELGLLIFDDGYAHPTSAPKEMKRTRWNRILFEVYRDHFLRPAA